MEREKKRVFIVVHAGVRDSNFPIERQGRVLKQEKPGI